MSQHPGQRPHDPAANQVTDDPPAPAATPQREPADAAAGTGTPGGPGGGGRHAAPRHAKDEDTDGKRVPELNAGTILEQMGGVSGVIYSAVPVIVFVIVVTLASLTAAIWAAIGSAVLILVVRLVRKEPLQPAISGVIGVAIAAFIAWRTGSAKGYFALGIWYSVALGVVFLASVVVRWPLAGVIWSFLNNTGMAWRRDKVARRYYDVATGVWILVFAARFVVQQYLYNADQVGWLGFARIAMGLPLTGLAALVTIWAVRMADKRAKAIAPAAPEPAPASGPDGGADVRLDTGRGDEQ